MLRALLIDDEASARADLRTKLAVHLGVTVVGEAATVGASRGLLAGADYDLVFLDVQLIGGESFALLPEVRAGASVVFATAHDRYAARAFESRAVDYLLKPIDPTRLTEALRRAAAATQGSARAVRPVTRRDPPRPEGPAHFVEVPLTADERIYLRQCLEAWEESLPPAHVLRAGRQRAGERVREVCYEPEAEPTRLFLAGAPVSRARRWWRAVRRRLEW